MTIRAVKTPLVKAGDDICHIIAVSIKNLPEKSVVVIASKIFSFCENRLVKKISGEKEEKQLLARQEADYYIDPHSSKYNLMLTIKGNWMFVNAGIDESNADNQYSLWPKDPQKSVNAVWKFLRRHYRVKQIGVIMSDSKSFPLNWGVVGHGIAHCGFKALKSYIGKPDLFGRLMQMEKVNLVQSIAVAAVLEMGEGNEQTPMAIVTDIKSIVFQSRPPTTKELNSLKINLEDDAYAPILLRADWQKGSNGKSGQFTAPLHACPPTSRSSAAKAGQSVTASLSWSGKFRSRLEFQMTLTPGPTALLIPNVSLRNYRVVSISVERSSTREMRRSPMPS